MSKLVVIENLGKIEKTPFWGQGSHYEIQKVKLGEKVFFRRQKIMDGKVSSSSYAHEINSKRWESSLCKFTGVDFITKAHISQNRC